MNYLSSCWSIAKNTYKEIIRDKILYGVLIVALLVTASSFFLATISLDQDARVLQDFGLASIHLFTLFICIFVATNSLNKDVERRALYLLFSKPISRSQYVLGKYLGFILLLVTTLLILGGLFSLGTFFTDRTIIRGEIITLLYSFLEISFLTAWAVLFASFTAPLNAALYSIALFIVGHSLVTLKQYVDKVGSHLLQNVMHFFYYVLPNLEKFDVRQAVLYAIHIPLATIIWTLFYWLVYTALILFLSVQVTKQREV